MYLMLQRDQPDDYVIATGKSFSLEEFTAEAFMAVGLDWRKHVKTDQALLRPSDHAVAMADPAKAGAKLGWRATRFMPDVVRLMVAAEQEANG